MSSCILNFCTHLRGNYDICATIRRSCFDGVTKGGIICILLEFSFRPFFVLYFRFQIVFNLHVELCILYVLISIVTVSHFLEVSQNRSLGEEPITLINAYNIHDVTLWRDLNPKFVLQTYRDAFSTASGNPDKVYIEDMYETCYNIMQKAIKNDADENGLIENSGTPDQTYDSWVMTGVSAYCGGLWLAALYAMISMADQLGKLEDRKLFENLFAKAKPAFEKKLWNGEYYDFDESKDSAKSIMADQLCGHWYLRCCGVEDYDIFPKDHVKTVLKNIYKNNVQSFCNGNMGAVNGFVNGKADTETVQSVEVWTGVTYALAATMIQEGMAEEGFHTAGGMYQSMVEKFGMAFDTPEALYAKEYFRALAYMRPLSIWSIQIAWDFEKKYLKC